MQIQTPIPKPVAKNDEEVKADEDHAPFTHDKKPKCKGNHVNKNTQ